jgi:hypothetical protein
MNCIVVCHCPTLSFRARVGGARVNNLVGAREISHWQSRECSALLAAVVGVRPATEVAATQNQARLRGLGSGCTTSY